MEGKGRVVPLHKHSRRWDKVDKDVVAGTELVGERDEGGMEGNVTETEGRAIRKRKRWVRPSSLQ